MAYFVAKELNLRPIDILTTWTVEELLVAYGVYSNQKSAEYVESIPKNERAKKGITWLDRWAVLFITQDQAEELTKDVSEAEVKSKNDLGLEKAAEILFSNN